jgi:hypothetical protein
MSAVACSRRRVLTADRVDTPSVTSHTFDGFKNSPTPVSTLRVSNKFSNSKKKPNSYERCWLSLLG